VVRSMLDLGIKLLFIEAYHYRYEATEYWCDGADFAAFAVVVHRGGKPHQLVIAPVLGGFVAVVIGLDEQQFDAEIEHRAHHEVAVLTREARLMSTDRTVVTVHLEIEPGAVAGDDGFGGSARTCGAGLRRQHRAQRAARHQ